jgi:hypothetical protein
MDQLDVATMPQLVTMPQAMHLIGVQLKQITVGN